MTKSEKKLIIFELFLIVLFLLNIFVKKYVKYYFVLLILILSSALIIPRVGYEKDNIIDNDKKKKLIKYICIYSFALLALEYCLGFIVGFTSTPFRKDIVSIFKNTLIIILTIILSEFLRYLIVRKGEKKKIIQILVVILFILVDAVLSIKNYNLNKLDDLLEFLTIILLPSFFKNLVLTIFVNKYGFKQNIIYRLILELYIYIIPFVPNLGIYLESILNMTFPILLSVIITIGFEKEKKIDFRKSKIKTRILTSTIILTTSLIILLNSNLFRFWMAAVASGSMEPTINIGDVIIVDKGYQKHPNKLKSGDILVFKIGEKIYTHRIMDVKETNENYEFKTKGDRKGQLEDDWIVTNKDVIGIVKFKIKYVGYPTVWLSRVLEERI